MTTDKKRDESRDIGVIVGLRTASQWRNNMPSLWERFVPHADLVVTEERLTVVESRAVKVTAALITLLDSIRNDGVASKRFAVVVEKAHEALK